MPLIYSLVSRGTCVLAEFTATSGNFTTVTRRILEKLPATSSRMSYLYDGREGQGGHVFHFVCEQGLVFLCMADEGFGRHVPFAFLDAVIRLWSSRYGDRGGSAVAYGMNDDFSAILQQQMDYHSSRSAADQINRVQGEIDEVRSIMVENIERVLERGEKIELLVDKTENLNHQAFRFKKQSRALRNMMWWKNVKIVLFALSLVAIAGLILSMIICGIDFSNPELASLVDWASLAFFFGSCVSYLVIIGDTFGTVTAMLGSGSFFVGGEAAHFSTLALMALVIFTGAVLAPLSMLRDMDSLQPTSGIAMACILYAVAVVVLTPAADGEHNDLITDTAPPRAFVFSAQSLLSLPTMAFCFASQSLFPPALETLHQPATYEYMNTVVNTTMGLTLVLHVLVAFGGYMRYGASVSANVLDSLPQTPAVGIARVAIVLAFAFTYPMMIFLCRMHIQSIMARLALARQQTDQPRPSAPPEEMHTLISSVLVGGSLVTAVLFPNIDAIFGLLGGTTAVVISFVAPALFWERFVGYMYPWSHPRKLFCKALLGFAIVIAGLSLPGLLIDAIGNLYATAWWTPVASAGQGLQTWKGGLNALRTGEIVTSVASEGVGRMHDLSAHAHKIKKHVG